MEVGDLSEVIRLGEVTNLLYGHPAYHVNVIKLKWENIWTGGLPHPPKRVTSPTWGPPPPSKQALRWILLVVKYSITLLFL